MRSMLNLVGLLLALAVAAWVGKTMLTAAAPPSPRSAIQPGAPGSNRTPADAQATVDQARRDLDEAARQAAQRLADADK